MLQLNNVTKRFGGLTAVDRFSCTVEKGEIVGLIGPNGAGKTTLFNVITGSLPADEGEVTFEAEPITQLRPDQVCRRGLCRSFQIVKPFANITVLDNVLIGALVAEESVAKARERAMAMLRLVGLDGRRHTLARGLTIGNRKRLEVGRALATDPSLLLLDEPVGGLNPTEVNQLMDLVRDIVDRGVTVLMIEHCMQAIMSVSDRILVMHHGRKIAEGKPSEVAVDPQVVKAYLGEEYYIAAGTGP
jgi:branched-chain amino acid transport system ATP-binding protein